MSKDPAKVSVFYEKVFDWKIKHMPEMNYRLVETGGQGGVNEALLRFAPFVLMYEAAAS